MSRSDNIIQRAAATAWIAVLLGLTLMPSASLEPYDRPTLCLLCGTEGTADAILNVLLFVPLGLLMARAKNAWLRAAAVGLALSLGVESVQLLVPGRHPALGDIIWNTSGAALGVLIHHVALDRLRRTRGPGTRGFMVALATGLSIIATGWLLEPDPSTELYWSLWTPQLGGMAYYDGRVLDTRLDGRALPSGEFPGGQNPLDAWLTDWTFEATLETGARPPRLAPVVSLIDIGRGRMALLGVVGEDLVWQERLRAGTLGFHQPDLRITSALGPLEEGDTARIEIRRVGMDRCIDVDGHGRCRFGFTPGRTWSLLTPAGRLSERQRRGLDLIWLMALGLPTGFMAIGRRAVGRSGLVLVALLFASAWITPLGYWRLLSESLSVLVGVALGAWGVAGIRQVCGFADPRPSDGEVP